MLRHPGEFDAADRIYAALEKTYKEKIPHHRRGVGRKLPATAGSFTDYDHQEPGEGVPVTSLEK